MRLRANERVLTFPRVNPPSASYPNLRLQVFPGRYLAAMDPPLYKTETGILLHSAGDGFTTGGAAEAQRADCATILRLGPVPGPDDPAFEAALSMHRQLVTGDRVMLTPYVNRFKELDGVRDAHISGLDGDNWDDTTVAKMIPGGWQLLSDWVAVELERQKLSIPKNVIRRVGAAVRRKTIYWEYEDWGEVIGRGSQARCDPGDKVLLLGKGDVRNYDCKYFICSQKGPRPPFPPSVVFFKEASFQAAERPGELEYETRIGALLSV